MFNLFNSRSLINTGLSFTNETKDFQATLFYNVMGRKIFAVGFEGYPDLYEMPRNVVDLTFSKGFNERWTIKGGVQDLLNQPWRIMQDANKDNKLKSGTDLTVQKYRTGQLLSLGFSYRLL